MRRLLLAGLLALVLVAGVVGFAAGQVVASLDADDDHISACVSGTDLATGPAKRAWTWIDEDRGTCLSTETKIDWPNDLGD